MKVHENAPIFYILMLVCYFLHYDASMHNILAPYVIPIHKSFQLLSLNYHTGICFMADKHVPFTGR